MRTSGSPCVAVFGLGGTIAMTQASDGGVSPVLSASDLVAAVPGLSDLQAELRVRDFRLPRLSGLVLLAGLLHRLLVSTAERFRLRAYVLRRGFGVATHFLLKSTKHIRERRAAAEAEWSRIDAARADLRTLSAESLRTFHVLLRSLAAEPR